MSIMTMDIIERLMFREMKRMAKISKIREKVSKT